LVPESKLEVALGTGTEGLEISLAELFGIFGVGSVQEIMAKITLRNK
jgi:hypothetical protein